MLERVSPPLVRAPVRSRQRYRRWDQRRIQFVRDASPKLLDLVPLYLGPGRRVDVDDVALDDRRDADCPDGVCCDIGGMKMCVPADSCPSA